MFPRSLPYRGASMLQWPGPSSGPHLEVLREPAADSARDVWMAAFVKRLGELRPHEDENVLLAMAADLWADVGGHDPVIAAEMEHEAGFGDD